MVLLMMLCSFARASTTLAQTEQQLGAPCDLAACTCDGRSLASVRHTTWNATSMDSNSDYAYKFSICDPIPQHDLPVGCQQNNSVGVLDQHATVIKYKPSEPLDCIELGSAMNMTGQVHGDVVNITYSFAFGCTNTFDIAITDKPPGPGEADRRVTQGGLDGCSYSTTWTHSLEPDSPPPPPPSPPPSPPPLGMPCDLKTCTCVGKDLSALQNHDYHTAVDAEGWIYQFAVCGTLSGDALPIGCRDKTRFPQPSVVRYKEIDEEVCDEIGSVGCGVSHGEEMCSLTAAYADDSTGSTRPLLLHYTYNTVAERNTFTIAFVEANPVVPHASIEPGPVLTYNDVIRSPSGTVFLHTYNTTWNCLNDLTTCGDHAPPYNPPTPEPETPANDDGLSFDKVLWAVGAGLVVGAIGIGLAVRSHRNKQGAGSLENLHSNLAPDGDSAADLRTSW